MKNETCSQNIKNNDILWWLYIGIVRLRIIKHPENKHIFFP